MTTCDACKTFLISPKTCSRCKLAHYCNSHCQKQHWKSGHNKSCKPYNDANLSSNCIKANDINLRQIGKEVCCDGHCIIESTKLNLPTTHSDILNSVLAECDIWHQVGSGSMYGKIQTNLDTKYKSVGLLHQKIKQFANELQKTHSLLNDMLYESTSTIGIMIDDTGFVSQEHVVELRKPKGARICILYPTYACQTSASISHFKDTYPVPLKEKSMLVVYNCDASSRTKIKIKLKKKEDGNVNKKKRVWIGLFQFFYSEENTDVNIKNRIHKAIESYYPTTTCYLDNNIKHSKQDPGNNLQPSTFINATSYAYYDDEFIEKQEIIYNQICKDFTTQIGFQASHNSRKIALPLSSVKVNEGEKEEEAEQQQGSSLKYGEIFYRPLAIAIQKIQNRFNGLQNPGDDIFVDLGSGTGKPCIAAALIYPFKKVIGIEVLEDLFKLSMKLKMKYETCLKRETETKDNLKHKISNLTQVEYICDDITKTTYWYNANVVFCNSLAFDQELCNKVADMAINLKPGAFFISSGNINNPKYGNNTTKFEQYFTNLDYKAMRYSWGLSSVYIHRRNHQEVNV